MTTLPIDMKARRFEVGADEKFGMAVLIEIKTPKEAKAVLAAIWEQTEAPMNDRPRFDIASAEDVARVEAKLDRLMSMLSDVDIKPKPEWLRLKDAAEHYGCSVDTIRRRIDSGALQARGSGKLREVKVG